MTGQRAAPGELGAESPGRRAPALPLLDVFGDPDLADRLGRDAYVRAWLRVERALLEAEVDEGLIDRTEAAQVAVDIASVTIDLERLDAETRIVGYPILPFLRQIADRSVLAARYTHWGATTQDIMDTALTLVVRDALARLRALLVAVGDALAAHASQHRTTVMTGRTHARPAVPTTFGAKAAVWLEETGRHLDRLDAVTTRLCWVSLHGGGGTSAALGESASAVRAGLATRLGLRASEIPWHSARDVIAEVGFVVAASAVTAGRIAREVIDLSRPEIGEVSERGGHLRGASSTMPQKANPISCEVVVGFSHLATSMVPALLDAMRVEHERSAGEWQVEWDALPTLLAYGGGALVHLGDVLTGLRVHPERMRLNLEVDGGLIMSEAAMMALAPTTGRDVAHDVVYEAATRTRRDGGTLAPMLRTVLGEHGLAIPDYLDAALSPTSYTGNAANQADTAVAAWSARRPQSAPTT